MEGLPDSRSNGDDTRLGWVGSLPRKTSKWCYYLWYSSNGIYSVASISFVRSGAYERSITTG